MVEAPSEDIEISPPIPATTLPIVRIDFLHIEEPPEEVSNTGEASSSLPKLLELDPISPASLPEMEFEDTIILAPPPGVNMASSQLNEVLACESSTKMSMALIANADEELQSFKEALSNSDKWRVAIKSELDSHIENGTWEAGKLPSGRREISSKWVFKTKVNADGSLRYKAHLVVRGFEQREGLDY